MISFGFTFDFIGVFFTYVWLALPLFVGLLLLIILLGQIAGRLEGWGGFETFYWSLITALTIGYGDVVPRRGVSKVLAILIGLLGIIFTGIMVSVAIESASIALKAK